MKFRGEYAFLSNFYSSPRTVLNGKWYPTVEHAFQALKTLFPPEREMIRLADSPAKAKSLGRKVHLRGDWHERRVEFMYRLVRQKFSDPALAARLLATGDIELVENNHWRDTFWGVCDGVGENNLGKILMRVREELKET